MSVDAGYRDGETPPHPVAGFEIVKRPTWVGTDEPGWPNGKAHAWKACSLSGFWVQIPVLAFFEFIVREQRVGGLSLYGDETYRFIRIVVTFYR